MSKINLIVARLREQIELLEAAKSGAIERVKQIDAELATLRRLLEPSPGPAKVGTDKPRRTRQPRTVAVIAHQRHIGEAADPGAALPLNPPPGEPA